MFRSIQSGSRLALVRPALRPLSTSAPLLTRFIQPVQQVPGPTEKVPDVESFLTQIGRNMKEHAQLFETWESLMTVKSEDLKQKGVDTRQRRYLLAWLERFRRGASLVEHTRGKKRWGGERKRAEVRARHFGRLRAEERQN